MKALLFGMAVAASAHGALGNISGLMELFRKEQIQNVVKDHITPLVVKNPALKGTYVVPVRNIGMGTPYPLNFYIARPDKILQTLPDFLEGEKGYSMAGLRELHVEDVNGDGYRDIVAIGFATSKAGSVPFFRVYLNDKRQSFLPNAPEGVPQGRFKQMKPLVDALKKAYKNSKGKKGQIKRLATDCRKITLIPKVLDAIACPKDYKTRTGLMVTLYRRGKGLTYEIPWVKATPDALDLGGYSEAAVALGVKGTECTGVLVVGTAGKKVFLDTGCKDAILCSVEKFPQGKARKGRVACGNEGKKKGTAHTFELK